MKENIGGDYFSLGWKYPGQALQVIPGPRSRVTNPYVDGTLISATNC